MNRPTPKVLPGDGGAIRFSHVNPIDVIFGRGQLVHEHPGTKVFNSSAKQHVAEYYSKSTGKKGKV
jgi:hypothetical protein